MGARGTIFTNFFRGLVGYLKSVSKFINSLGRASVIALVELTLPVLWAIKVAARLTLSEDKPDLSKSLSPGLLIGDIVVIQDGPRCTGSISLPIGGLDGQVGMLVGFRSCPMTLTDYWVVELMRPRCGILRKVWIDDNVWNPTLRRATPLEALAWAAK